MKISARTMLIGSLLLVGCSGAAWQKVSVAPGYQAPKVLTIAIVQEAKGDGSEDAIAALKESLTAELEDNDIKVTFVAAGGEDAKRADVTVVEWDEGSRVMRWLVGFGAGQGRIVLVVKSPSANGKKGLDGKAEGYINGGTFGGDSAQAATDAGTLIGSAIASGDVD